MNLWLLLLLVITLSKGGNLPTFDPAACTIDQFLLIAQEIPIEEMLIYGQEADVLRLLENKNLSSFWETYIPKTLQLPCYALKRLYPAMILKDRHHADNLEETLKCIFNYDPLNNPERQEIWRLLKGILEAPFPEKAVKYLEFLDRLFQVIDHFEMDDPFLARLDLFIGEMTAPQIRSSSLDSILAPLPPLLISGVDLTASDDVEIEQIATENKPKLLIALEAEDETVIIENLENIPRAALHYFTPILKDRLNKVYDHWEDHASSLR